jgi:hypothetical protein
MNKTAKEKRQKWLFASIRRQLRTGVTQSRMHVLRRIAQRRERVYDLLLAPDVTEPKIFDAELRDAVRQAIYCVFECDDELKSYRRARTPWGRKDAILGATVVILSSTPEQDRFTRIAKLIPGVRIKPRTSSSMHALLREHGALLKELEARRTGEERRVSVLLDLVKIEHLLLGYWWGA